MTINCSNWNYGKAIAIFLIGWTNRVSFQENFVMKTVILSIIMPCFTRKLPVYLVHHILASWQKILLAAQSN